jgi:signal peptidase I
MKIKAFRLVSRAAGSWLAHVAVAGLLIFAARSALADWNHVPTGSMKPTILEGDVIFVNRLAYDLKVPFTQVHIAQWDNPARGDIVVLTSPADGSRLVKRVVGLPGDEVAMRDNVLFINGEHVDYGPLDHRVVERVSGLEQVSHEFAREVLGRHRHAVMASLVSSPQSSFGPLTVPEGKYLVLGDNRDHSADSRYFGFVDRGAILGRALAVIASFDLDHHYLPRADRFLVTLE